MGHGYAAAYARRRVRGGHAREASVAAVEDAKSVAAVVRGEGAMTKYGKRDANHNEIRDAARRMGATVIDTPG